MNEWVQKSIEVANAPGYLDRLAEIYPAALGMGREIPLETIEQIKGAYDKRDALSLIMVLLRLDKFPVNDSYVAFLRRGKGKFIDYNPETVSRIAERLFSIGFDELIAGCEEPKAASKKFGPAFRRWLPMLGYPILPETEFDRHKGIVLLAGSNGEKMDYANRVLGCNLTKGIDLLAKAGNSYVIGEAKFITDSGGGQFNQLEGALGLVRGKGGNAIRIAVLDGIVWIRSRNKFFRGVSELEGIAMSALLLKEFLESLR